MSDAPSTADCLTLADMRTAHERIRPRINGTPELRSDYMVDLTGAGLFCKCKNFQEAGAFKVRGACNAVFGLNDAAAKRGVATHSSGNHALSLSYAASRSGIPSNVVMPRTAPQTKKGRCAPLWRDFHRMRALDHLARGGICRSTRQHRGVSSYTPITTRA